MRIIVCGAGGRLAGAVESTLLSAGHTVIAVGHAQMDVTSATQVDQVLERIRPEVIVNCSAYNDVDRAEQDRAAAFAINARGPSLLAAAADRLNAVLVHYGTDFVFDGTASEPHSEDHPRNPVNVYGASKMAGEMAVQRTRAHYVLRVASLFGGLGVRGHRSTVDWIAARLLTGVVVNAVIDRVVSPSYVFDVARATRALLEQPAPFGTYHCVNSGFSTWFDLATEVARVLGIAGRIEPVFASDVHTTASRPRFCALSNHKLRSAGIEMPTWQNAIRQHLGAGSASEFRPRAGAA